MRLKLIFSVAIALFLGLTSGFAQDKKTPDLIESCEMEADRLEGVLDLEPWQTFRVDSTLKHDYPAMNEEIMHLREAKFENSDIYQAVQDKWLATIDESYKRIFTPEQWAVYLKQGAARSIAAREKRIAKREGKEVSKKKK